MKREEGADAPSFGYFVGVMRVFRGLGFLGLNSLISQKQKQKTQ